jgi:ubiquinone/menaquinone biosynthesis C-methylase UbiE
MLQDHQVPTRNVIIDRFMAWFMARGGRKYDFLVEARKKELLSGISGTLVEIGSGTGPNLRHLPDDIRFVAIEPNTFMHPHFFAEADEVGREASLIQADAEALPFPDNSVEAVLTTLVLCSLKGLDAALKEILRILKPGGTFIFLEHVGAPKGSWLRSFQSFIRPAWSAVGDGCEPDRDTEERLHRAGFSELQLERFTVPVPLVSPHIAGIARK